MVILFFFFLTAPGRNLMRQERREVLAVPLYPEPHASFVDEYQTYKLSEVSSQSKHNEALNIPWTWRALQNPVFSKTADTATFPGFNRFYLRWTTARFLRVVPSYKQSVDSARPWQFKVVCNPFPRRLYFWRRQGFGYESGSQPAWNELICVFQHCNWIF